MLTFKRLITLVVPSSILGLSWFWWRWKNKALKANDMDTHSDTTPSVNSKSNDLNDKGEVNDNIDAKPDNEINLSEKYVADKSIVNADIETKDCPNFVDLEDKIKSLDIGDLLVTPCIREINIKDEEVTVAESDTHHDEAYGNVEDENDCNVSAVIEDEISILMVNDVECENIPSENSISSNISNERSHSIISQLSVDCVQEDLGSDEFSPIQFSSTNGKRIRNQSSCGDSAIVEDYSSDALSITGSDSAIKSSEGDCSTESQPLAEEQCFKKGLYPQENGRNYRDWYGPSIGSSDFKEKPEKSRHWGSLPVSDTDSDSECILKRTAKIGSVSLDKLSIQLNEELSKMKSPERTNSSKSSRYPKQSRRRNRKSESRTPKKTSAPKPSPQPKKNDSSRRQRSKSKSNCGSPKKDIDKPWRNHETPKKFEKLTIDENAKRVTVEYEFPDDMCGRLIGKSGRHISEFKESTGVDICIECELHGKNRIVSMTGILSQIQSAEKQLNEKFHDSLTLVNFPDLDDIENISVVILPENTEFNVVVTAIIDAGNFYVQLCNRDVEEKLIQLQTELYGCYVTPRPKYIYKDTELPLIDEYCVSFVENVWCRLKVLDVCPETRMVDAFFIDYGGNVTLSIDFIWRIRSDMLQLPAQAMLCRLNNAIPVVGATDFSYEANELFYQLVGAKALQAYVSCTRDDIPYIQLSYFDEERGEMFSVLEQMQLWGLVQDQSIPPQYMEQLLDEDITQLSESPRDDYLLPLQDESTPFVESLLNCSAQQFVCAS